MTDHCPIHRPGRTTPSDPADAAESSAAPSGPCPARAAPRGGRLRRAVFAAAGFVAVGIAWIAVFVPGLPTTVWLFIACWCFARSCPWLEERLVRTRFFAPFLRYLDPDEPLSRGTRLSAMAAMWTAISISGVVLALREPPLWSVVVGLVAAGAVGTVVIARVRRGPRPAPEEVGADTTRDHGVERTGSLP